MARTVLTPIEAPGGRPLTLTDATPVAADTSNGNRFLITGREILIIENTGGSTHTVTFQTIAVAGRQDPNHNTAINVAAGAQKVCGPFPLKEYKQTDGYLYVTANHAEVTFTVLKLPS